MRRREFITLLGGARGQSRDHDDPDRNRHGGDPVQAGLVASLNRPGGNVTGSTTMGQELAAKRFGLLHELKPGTAPFAMLTHPTNPNLLIRESQAAAASIKRPIEVLYASTGQDIDTIVGNLVQKRIGGLAIPTEIFLTSRCVQTATLAIRRSIPTMYGDRADAAAAVGISAQNARHERCQTGHGMAFARLARQQDGDYLERCSLTRLVPIVAKVVMIEFASVSAKYLLELLAQFCSTVELPDMTSTV
jgi:hypothetical protein